MEVITPGHKYLAENFENKEKGQLIQFIEKIPSENSGLITLNDGTTNEELLKVLLDRMNYLDDKFPCEENKEAIKSMQQALNWLDLRTAKRTARGVEGTHKQ